MKNAKQYGPYEAIFAAHTSAIENKWIVRMGYDAKRKEFWIEYIGRAA